MTYDDRFLSHADLEQLLADASLDDPRLAELLSAATAPAQPAELAGLDDALAAFRCAPFDTEVVPSRRGRVMLKTFASGVVATKILAGAVGAAAVGGVALAAGAGQIAQTPTPHRAAASHVSPAAVDFHSRTPARPTAARPSPTPTPTHSTPPATHAHPSKSPSPALIGLCRTWKAHHRHADSRGRWLGHRGLTMLITTAGGPRKVNGYCTLVLAQAHKHRGPAPTPPASRKYSSPTSRPSSGHKQGQPIVFSTDSTGYGHSVAVPSRGGPQ